MRLAALCIGCVGAAAAFSPAPRSEPTLLLLSGDTDGYLAPCGCTKPMSGGIKRRVNAIRSLQIPGRTLILENAGLVAGSGRQDQIKAETLVEALTQAGWDAINVGPAEAALGSGQVLALQRLAQGKLLASGLKPSPTNELEQSLSREPFHVVGVSASPDALAAPLGEEAEALETTLSRAVAEAERAGLALVVLLQGGEQTARDLARAFPSIALIQFRASGSPAAEPLAEGRTWLVSPGEKGKHVLRLEFADGRFTNYQAIDLSPAFADDASTSRLYDTYLDRVRAEALLDTMPRTPTAAFAGNKTCGNCHTVAKQVWRDSEHANALRTLEQEKHDADPDCVSCHVVGLESTKGFISRMKTPELANVGCESCHGPGQAHAFNPTKVSMPRVGERSCLPCHDVDNSPNFVFNEYWSRIRH